MNCPHISYGELIQRIHEKAPGQRIPLGGSIEVSDRCNLGCAHCYINLPPGDVDARQRELSAAEWMGILDQLTDEGCIWMLLTGGEPFLRPDFLDIYTHAKKKGLLVTIFTNGTTLTPRIADHLAEWPPHAVEITLYGRTQATYERVTGVPGSYARCMQGIELLLERDLTVKLKTVIMTLNQDEIWDMQAYAGSLGLDFRFDPVLNLRLDGARRPAAVRLSPEEVVALDLADEKRVKEWRKFIEQFSGPPSHPEYLYDCGAGIETFHIDTYGQMSACMMARSPSYDLRQGSFKEGWQEFLPKVFSQKRTRESPCQSCELMALCGQCPGFAQMECGDQEARVEYLCQIAHMRAEAFGTQST